MGNNVFIPGPGGSGGIQSINGSSNSTQIIAAGTGISIISASGTTTISASGGSIAPLTLTATSNTAVMAYPDASSQHDLYFQGSNNSAGHGGDIYITPGTGNTAIGQGNVYIPGGSYTPNGTLDNVGTPGLVLSPKGYQYGFNGIQWADDHVIANSIFLISDNHQCIGTRHNYLGPNGAYDFYIVVGAAGGVYPDAAYPTGTINLGLYNSYWGQVFAKAYKFDTQLSSGLSRSLKFEAGGWNGVGLGFDTTLGNEYYLKLYDESATTYTEAFNVVCNARKTIVSAPVETTNGFAAQTLVLKGADNAGTSQAGDLVLSGSSAASGNPGSVFIPVTLGAPSHTPNNQSGFAALGGFDYNTNKLWIYNSALSSWVSVTLS